MAKDGFKIELGPEWGSISKWISAFEGNFKKASMQGTKKACLYVMSEITGRIRGGRYEELAPSTLAVKQALGYSSTPLIRRGALLRAVTTDVYSAFEGAVGIRKMGRGTDAQDVNVALILHEGATIKITDAMRKAFARRLGRLGIQPDSGRRKSSIRIPPRPFMKEVFEDPTVLRKIEQIYLEEIQKATGL